MGVEKYNILSGGSLFQFCVEICEGKLVCSASCDTVRRIWDRVQLALSFMPESYVHII